MTSLITLIDTFLDEEDEPLHLPSTRHQRRLGAPDGCKPNQALPATILNQVDGDETFEPSYAASHNERLMLQQALAHFYRERIISDVLAPVKGGKDFYPPFVKGDYRGIFMKIDSFPTAEPEAAWRLTAAITDRIFS